MSSASARTAWPRSSGARARRTAAARGAPAGGAPRSRGRAPAPPRAHRGYDYVHQAIDDMSRVVYAAIFPDERGTTCAAFLRDAGAFFARLGVRIERVMTDNAKNYTRSRAFAEALA